MVGLTGCGSNSGQGSGEEGNANPSKSPSSATPSPTASDESASGALSGETDPGTVAAFAKRDLCVNASDYYYVLTSFSGATPPAAEPDAGFVRAGIGRGKNLADTLVEQLPQAQRGNAQGAAKTWRVLEREGRQRGYKADDLPAFFADITPEIKAYIPGNAALTQYLSDTCATQVPDFGTVLAPPT